VHQQQDSPLGGTEGNLFRTPQARLPCVCVEARGGGGGDRWATGAPGAA